MLQSKTARWSTGTALLCVVLLAIAWFVVVSPRRAQAAQVQAQVLSQTQQNDQLQVTVDQLKAEFVQLPVTRSQLAEIRNQLPPTEDLPGLLRTVEGLATSAGVTLLSFSPGSATALGANGAPSAGSAAAAMTELPLTLMVNGEYFQVVTFLRQLQTGIPRVLLISGLQITTAGGAAGAVAVTVTARVFSLPSSATAAATPGSAAPADPAGQVGVAATAAPSPSATPGPTGRSTPGPTAGATVTPSPKSTGAIALPQATGSAQW